MSSHIDFATTDFKSHIVNNIIKPNYIVEIQDSTENRMMWKKRGMRLETCSKFFIGLGGIISFSSGFYNYPTLSFISGAISTVSLVLLQYANFSYKESKKATSDLNILLDNIGIKKVPELNTTTQDNNEILSKGMPVKQPTEGGSGYTVKVEQPVLYSNPLLHSDQSEEYKNRLKYEDYCETNQFDEVLKMHKEQNFTLTELVIQQSARHKNFEFFKLFISMNIPITGYDILFTIASAGKAYTQLFFENNYTWNFKLKKNQVSPILGAILSNDLENCKLIQQHCGKVWMIDSCEEVRQAYKNKNNEIIKFCIENGALTSDEYGDYTVS